MYESNTLKNEVIIVTGGGSGLGLAMTKRFVDLGARVAICGRSSEKLANARKEIANDASFFEVQCDVRENDAVGRMFDAVENRWGTVTRLVNNAAGNFLSAAEDLSSNAFRAVIDIVLQGTFHCTQQFGKRLIAQQKPGVALNIVTTYTECGSAFVLPSACAKAGVYALTTSLAYEWATYGIRMNAIAPGPFPTEGAWSRLIPNRELEATFKKGVPLGRFGKPEELANLAVFLLSDLSGFITGECVTIDGGERLSCGQFNFLAREMPRAELKAAFQAMRPKK